jgi:hypothetical protein
MDLLTDVKDTHTWDYHVIAYCIQRHDYAHFSLRPNAQGECMLDVTDWDAEERETLHNYLQQHRIRYDLERVLRDCED